MRRMTTVGERRTAPDLFVRDVGKRCNQLLEDSRNLWWTSLLVVFQHLGACCDARGIGRCNSDAVTLALRLHRVV
jgi:hypothetical protein